MKKYKLLKDFTDPNGTVGAGVIKDAHQWMSRFALLNENDLDIKDDWFELVTEPSIVPEIDKQKIFQSVLKTLKNNRVMVDTREDGIYVRLAGKESLGEAFTLHFGLVYPFYAQPPVLNDTVVEDKEPIALSNDETTAYFNNAKVYLDKINCTYATTKEQRLKIIQSARFIDIRVRADGREYFFEGEFIKSLTNKKYTQSEVDAMMEDTWKAARDYDTRHLSGLPRYKYNEISDYKSTLPLQQVQEDKPVQEKKVVFPDEQIGGSYYYPLWKFFHDEHSLLLTVSEMQEIITAVEMFNISKQPEAKDKPFVITDEFVKLFLMSNSIGDTQLNNWEKFKQSNHVPKQSPTNLQESKGGIEINSLRLHDNFLGNKVDTYWYQFCSNKVLDGTRFPAITQAIESCLNEPNPQPSTTVKDAEQKTFTAPASLSEHPQCKKDKPNTDTISTKTVLFTTEDGVGIMHGQDYWHVVSDWTPQKETAQEFGREEYQVSSLIRFSTKEAAEQYIIDNKPCLSLNDLKQYQRSNGFNCVDFFGERITKLQELVNQKLKQHTP